MASTYTLISSNVLSGTAASVTFSSIPSTYTDLVLRCSTRATAAGTFQEFFSLRPNGSAGTNATYLSGTGSSVNSSRPVNQWYSVIDGNLVNNGGDSAGNTANTFTSTEWYIPNYALTQARQVSGYGVSEQNGSTAYMSISANYSSSTTAITSILLNNLGTFATGSSFYLYGIKNS